MLYDDDLVYKICPKKLKIHKNKEVLKCPYCLANYSKEFDGKLCDICNLSQIGLETLGLKYKWFDDTLYFNLSPLFCLSFS